MVTMYLPDLFSGVLDQVGQSPPSLKPLVTHLPWQYSTR